MCSSSKQGSQRLFLDYVEVPPRARGPGPSNQQVRKLRPRTQRKDSQTLRSDNAPGENDILSTTDGDASGEEYSDNSRTGHSKRKRKHNTTEKGGTSKFQKTTSSAGGASKRKKQTPLNRDEGQSPLLTQLKKCQAESNEGQHPHESCNILASLDLVYLEELRAIACLQHQSILPSNSIMPHLNRRHDMDFPRHLKKSKLGEILDHIKAVFPETGVTFETLALPGILTSPLEGFSHETIRYRFMCPEAECQKWITRNDTYDGGPKTEFHHHLSVEHKIKCWPTDVKSGWVQAIRIHSAAKSQGLLYHLFHLDNYQPPGEIQPSFPTKVLSAPPNATWFKDLQWCEFRQRICHIPLHEIQSLVAPPSRQLVEAHQSRNNSRPSRHRLELGLLRLRNHITEYIDNAQQFISSIHESYRVGLRPR